MIGFHIVSRRDFALLSAGGGDREAIETLLAGQFSRRLLLLQAVRESARQISLKTHALLDTAYTLLADVQHQRPDVVRTVLTLPCTGMWAAACLRDGGDQTHRYLACLAATAALRANRDFEIEVPAWDGMVYLPTLGSVSLRTPGARTARIQSLGRGNAAVIAGEESIRLPLGCETTAPGWRPVRQLQASAQGLELRVWLEDAGPFRGPAGLLLAPPLTQDQVTPWERVLCSAWRLLVRRHPEHAEAISAGLRVLTPLTARSERASTSVTAADAFGAVLLTPPSHAESLALTLLHESQHGKLAALHHLVPLHEDDSRARWYARWRDDPRPLNGLLQGAYAHLGVAGFWHEAMRSGRAPLRSMAAEELVYWCDAVNEALDQLSSSGALTHEGTCFISGMVGALAQLGSAPILGAPRRRAIDRGICDRMTWRMRHLRPDPAVTDSYALAWLTESRPAVVPEMTAVTLCAGERGALGSTRLLLARRTTRNGPEDRLDLTAADIDYAQGRHGQALAGYKSALTDNPGDSGSWAGLALVLRNSNSRRAASFLADYPELVRAIALRLRALSGSSVDPVAFTQWIAGLCTEPKCDNVSLAGWGLQESVRVEALMSSEVQPGSILISYVGPDLMWAEWISEQLQRVGCVVDDLEWSGGPATDLAGTLRQAAESYRHCIAVLSSNYIRTVVPTSEAGEAVAGWALEHPGVLIPVLVRRCELPARFWQLSPADLREVSDDRIATRRLLSRVLGSRTPAPEAISEPMTRFPGRHPAVWSPDLLPRNPFFTGRDEMLRMLRGHLTTDVTALVPHSLQGLAGVGKTQLAVEYAYRFAADYDVVWWIPADKQATARKALADLAVRLDLGGPQTEIGELIRAAKDALRTGQPYQRWLLVFDSAGSPASIQPLMPSGPGHVLITSRDQTWDRHADALDVDVYRRVESIEFLRRRSAGLSESDADRLAAELGDMPLALEHAAGWLSTTSMVLDDYLSLLSKHTSEVLNTGHFANYEASVAATWTISMNQLREVSPAASQMLDLCAFVGPDPISIDLLVSAPADALPTELYDALRSAGQRVEILQAIRSYSLARVFQGPGREPSLQQHRLVQAVARDLIPADRQAAYREFAHKLLATANPGDPMLPANWPAYDVLLPHVLSSGAATRSDPAVRALVLGEARMLQLRGEYQSSLELSTTAVDAWSAVLDETDRDMLLARRGRGNALRGLSRFTEALQADQEVYNIVLERQGPDHPDTLLCISGLAADYRRSGNFEAARQLDQHAVDVLTRETGPDDRETLRHAHNLAVDHRLAGEFVAAFEINRHGADVLARVLGLDAFSTLYAVNDMARDLRELGRYYESLSVEEQTFTRYREVFGPDSPDTMRAMKNLAVSRRKAGRYMEAAELAEEVLDRHSRKFGRQHPETLAATTNFANDHRCLGQYAEGRDFAELALHGFREVLGEDHPYTAASAVNLAALMRLTEDAEGAQVLNEQSLQQLRAAFGPNHRYTLSCAANLASDLAKLGDIEAARELGERTLAALRETSGEDHPYTLSCAVNLALDLRAVGKQQAFRELFADTMERYKRTLGNAHPETAAAAVRERAVCDIEPPPV